MKDTGTGALSYKYLGEIVSIYNYLKENYEDVYFSEFLEKPSACVEIKGKKYEFYVGENAIQNNELWLFSNWHIIKGDAGGGLGRKINNDLLDQVKNFLPPLEKEIDLFNWGDET